MLIAVPNIYIIFRRVQNYNSGLIVFVTDMVPKQTSDQQEEVTPTLTT